jgi:ABC-2 type transport system permease protein
MQKILTIARREYQAMVATKAFVVGMAMMPIMMMGGMWIPGLLKGMETAQDRRIVIVDGTGQLFDDLQLAAQKRNELLPSALVEAEASTKSADADSAPASSGNSTATSAEREGRDARRAMGLEEIHRYVLEQIPAEGFDDEKRLELSESIRNNELYAFIEIPENVLTASNIDLTSPSILQLPEIRYVAQDAALSDARRWADTSLTQLIRARRLSSIGVSPVALLELERKAPVVGSGLYRREKDGSIVSAEKPNEMAAFMLPMGVMMLMFMIVMMSAQPMLESVLEEKTLRISEVLLGSANARQLMTGKLLGNVAGSLTVFSLYAIGGYAAANWKGFADSIPFHILPWFVIYQVLAVLMFSSVFMAIAASVSQLREAQSLLLPVWMVMLLPMFVWFNVVREPNSTLAMALSFFPPSTPLMMILRLSSAAIIPLWQILLSIAVMVLGTTVGVLAAARIYRIGILWQGKTPKLTELITWLIRNPTASRLN